MARAGRDWIPQLLRDGENTVLDPGGRGSVHARLLGTSAILIVIFPSTTEAEHVQTLVTELLRSSHGPIRPPRPPSA